MGRAPWKGAVTFGLVEIPVALQSAAAREDEIEFTLLDRRDFAPVGYERVNKRTKEPVPWPCNHPIGIVDRNALCEAHSRHRFF